MVPLVAEELAIAIADLLTNPFRAASLAIKGYKTVSPWTWEATAQEKMRLIVRLTK
jgi:hypothetical protein